MTDANRNLIKGVIAGVVAGLAATAAKSLAEKFYPPRVHGEPEPTEEMAERISDAAGLSLTEQQKHIAAGGIHWGFGAVVGGAYGAIAEFYPAATSKQGAAFGMALAGLTHDTALPAIGLSAEAEDQEPREHTSEMMTHVVYGVVAETVRSIVRKML